MQTHQDTPDVVAEFPATAAQRRFWYLHQVDPDSVASNIAVHWELHGVCPAETIEQAFRIIISRHEILRTRFEERDGDLFQQVTDHTDFRLSTIDLRNLDAEEHASRIANIASELSDRPFDLRQPGHLRVALVRSQQDLTSILIAAHHAVFDGFSIRVLGDELGRVAAALIAGHDPDLPELALQYGDYALWQDACATSGARASDAAYWQRQLGDMPYFSLPHDRPTPPASQRSGSRVNVPLNPDFGDRLDAVARDLGTSAFSVGTAVTAAVLHRTGGQTDISFGSTYAGRSETELESLIGVFINPIVLRLQVHPTDTLSATVGQATDVVRQALSHGDYPFDQLVTDLRPPRDAKRTSLVSVMFSLQSVFLQEQSYGPLRLVSLPSRTPDITHDVAINITGRSSGWSMMIDYDVNRFDRRSIDALGMGIRDTFDALFEQPNLRLEDLPLDRPAPARRVPAKAAQEIRDAGQVPQTATEDGVRAIWAGILGLPPQDCDGDFFDLGGHSLLVLRMLARVGDTFGVRPGIADFLEAPTLAGFSRRLSALLSPGEDVDENEQDGVYKTIWLREGAPDAPLILSVNQPFLYFNLARHLDQRLACANLHVDSPDPLRDASAGRLDQLIDEAAQQALQIAGDRPVLLLGQCVDGVMAYRIAQRLADLGHPVHTLAMIDSWASRNGTNTNRTRAFGSRIGSKLRRLRNYSKQALLGQIGWQEFLTKFSIGKKALVRMGRLEPTTEAEAQEWEINHLLQDLVRAAPATPHDGETILFATASQTARARAERFGWGDRLAADVPIYTLPGWHEDALLSNGTTEIAAILQARLRRPAMDAVCVEDVDVASLGHALP